MYYLVVGFCTAVFCVLVVRFLAKSFYELAVKSVGQVDMIVDGALDEIEKEQHLISGAWQVFKLLIWCIFLLFLMLLPPLLIWWIWVWLLELDSPDTSSFLFYLSLMLGSGVLFLYPKPETDYPYWSRLLHTMVLEHDGLMRLMLMRELKGVVADELPYLVVTGLARAGTTAMTQAFYSSGRFHAISYANMPFLLAPEFWRKVYRPRVGALRERAHADHTLFSETSIESFEECYFQVMLSRAFIGSRSLAKHEVSSAQYDVYRCYQQLFRKTSSTHYLTKNNNFLVRYESLRKLDRDFVVILMFREPKEQAASLLRQHRHIGAKQDGEAFVRQYMDWLGHYEFGHGHKAFDFGFEPIWEKYAEDSLDYWLAIWVNYYRYVLTLPADSRLFLVSYEGFLADPQVVADDLVGLVGWGLDRIEVEHFPKTQTPTTWQVLDNGLLDVAQDIYEQLCALQIGR